MHLQRFGVALALAVGLCKPQSPTAPRPEFEVASIKPVKSDPRDSRPRFNCSAGGSFVASGVPLQYLIEWAFDIRTDFSVPDWAGINGERYNIEARPGEPVSQAQCKLMTQSLLQDRFKLKSHRETKEMPVFDLVVGKGGPKLKQVKVDGPPGDGVWQRGNKVSARGWEAWMIAATLQSIPAVGASRGG